EVSPLRVSGLPFGFDAILRRAVAREPADRYPRAADLLADLRAVAGDQAVAGLLNTLAIFDFETETGEAADNWIGSGIAENLGADLGRVMGLVLVPRSKVVRALAEIRGGRKRPGLAQLGLAVGCRWTLTGTYQRDGDRLRITARLVEAAIET